MKFVNQMKCDFLSRIENESFIRTSVVAFLMPLDLTLDELMEIKTILAEAIINAMIHGYEGRVDGIISLEVVYDDTCVEIKVKDQGVGIENVEKAMEPLYTSKQHLERSGMGLTIMSMFADTFEIESMVGEGTTLYIKKQIHHE